VRGTAAALGCSVQAYNGDGRSAIRRGVSLRRLQRAAGLAVRGATAAAAAAAAARVQLCDTRAQQLTPGSVVMLAGVGWTALLLGMLVCCQEKCSGGQRDSGCGGGGGGLLTPCAGAPRARIHSASQDALPHAPRPPPYNPEYLQALVHPPLPPSPPSPSPSPRPCERACVCRC
jgi:hypothetical protein